MQVFFQDPRRSISTRVFLGFFICIVLLVSTLGYFSYGKSKQIIQNKVAQASEETITQASDKLEFLLQTYVGITRQMMVDQELNQWLQAVNNNQLPFLQQQDAQNKITAKLNSIKSSDPSIVSIRLVPKTFDKSKVYASSGATAIQINDQIKPWFKSILSLNGEPLYMPVFKKGLFGFTNEPTFMVGRLLKNLKNRNAEYYVLIELKAKALENMFAKMKFGETGRMIIIGPNNKIVYSPNADAIETDAGIQIPINSDKDAVKSYHMKIGGAEQLVIHRSVALTNWEMAAMIPVSDLVQESKGILRLTVFMGMLAAVAAVIFGIIMTRMIGQPLERICVHMEEGAAGNLSVRMDYRGQDEIARLGQSFNRMMEQISILVERTNRSASEVLSTASELKDVSNQTVSASREIASVTDQIAKGAVQLAEQAEMGAIVTDSIGEKMRRTMETNEKLTLAAERVQAVSRQGSLSMEGLLNKTSETESVSRSLLERADKLKVNAESIRSILDMMDQLTKQTTILSLNASIEAARAGTAGKSFHVVAEEIRKLANQSKESIRVVEEITVAMQQEVAATVDDLTAITPLLQEQNEAVRESAGIFSGVRGEMDAFIGTIDETTRTISELDHSQHMLRETIGDVSSVSQEAAASSEEVATLSSEQLAVSGRLEVLSESLELLSEALNEQLSNFQIKETQGV